jgi:hypothetical protein
MAALPSMAPDPTLEAVRAACEERAAAELPRAYLGMSAIGTGCERRLWYSFRWAARERMSADSLWRIEDGHRGEDVMADRLRLVPGVHLMTVDPRTGRQFGYSDLAGHFRGHADGLIKGLKQAPQTLHVWEAKVVNETKATKLSQLAAQLGEKQALKAWDPVYHAQALVYMAYAETTRHYLTAATPGVRQIVSVRTDTDLDEARRLRAKAERVITAAEPLPRISKDPAWFECKFCPAHGICHGAALPPASCRTCVHATPEMDGNGRWSCARHCRDLTVEQQRAGCPDHLYIPALVSYAEQVDADAAANWISYRLPDGRQFRNGPADPASYPSSELAVMDPGMLADAGADELRAMFGARHVAPSTALQPPAPWGKAA